MSEGIKFDMSQIFEGLLDRLKTKLLEAEARQSTTIKPAFLAKKENLPAPENKPTVSAKPVTLKHK